MILFVAFLGAGFLGSHAWNTDNGYLMIFAFLVTYFAAFSQGVNSGRQETER
jgi:hypothetical protein